MQLNQATPSIRTHEGAKAKHINPELALRRSVMACMLWEDEFYESGKTIAERIAEFIPLVDPQKVADMAREARNKMKLRHVPLLLACLMARLPSHRKLVGDLLYDIIQRPDELCEFLAMYWKDGKCSIANQVKKGLAKAFTKFNAYQLGKYNRDNAIKLKDVLFLTHPKPLNKEQEELWKFLVAGTIATPDTWETSLSGGADKKATFERLINEGKLGAMALLRNLRGMTEANVEPGIIRKGLGSVKTDRILPFRYIAAARHAVRYEPELEELMFKGLSHEEKFPGETILLVDVSGSMDDKISSKSDMTRLDAACGVAMLLREVSNCQVFTFSEKLVEIPARRGFALRDAIVKSQNHSSTYLGNASRVVRAMPHDRLIVVTDEQSNDPVPDPTNPHSYMVNVASAKNGVGYGPWIHVDGWSEAVVDYIRTFEKLYQEAR